MEKALGVKMETINGQVEKIIFESNDSNYRVVLISVDGDEEVIVGNIEPLYSGDAITAVGNYEDDGKYGIRFIVKEYEIREPEELYAIEKYLSSGAIHGIGKKFANKIVSKFREDTLKIIENNPEKLAEIQGISPKRAKKIGDEFEKLKEFRNIMLFLRRYDISSVFAEKIYKKYGNTVIDVLSRNPYRLADDITGIGFKRADEIAFKMGFLADSDVRKKAVILHIINIELNNGNTYLVETEIFDRVKELVEIDEEELKAQIYDLVIDKKLYIKKLNGEERIYLRKIYNIERSIAKNLILLNEKVEVNEIELEKRLREIEEENLIDLDELQKRAVYTAAESGFVVITGGPGTGKTTTLNAIIKLFEKAGLEVLLSAPTGRAAKRMSETTGHEAQTIHRLLEFKMGESSMSFTRNRTNLLEADVVVVDEASMIDVYLMYSLLDAIGTGTRLILVGDVNQLPSVGPGSVLRDIISSEKFSVVRLNKIFRQAAKSDIVKNAHRINGGEQIEIDNNSEDFFLIEKEEAIFAQRTILSLVSEKLPRYLGGESFDIQILTPMRKGELGTQNLNKIMQQYLNPKSKDKREKQWNDNIFREGDKVMQIKNDYQIEWQVFSKNGAVLKNGFGVFNGDCGFIKEINEYSGTLTVEFDDNKTVEYDIEKLDNIELAYAITIHKSQGSEYLGVVIPLLSGPRQLMNRNLLYTAVTRAKKCVTIVGKKTVFDNMIKNEIELKRNTGLKDAILEEDISLSK